MHVSLERDASSCPPNPPPLPTILPSGAVDGYARYTYRASIDSEGAAVDVAGLSAL